MMNLAAKLIIGIWAMGLVNTGHAESSISYQELKPFFDQNCLRCHRDVGRSGGLNLERFPFVSELRNENPTQVVARIIARMQDPKFPMPPGTHLPIEEIARVQQWLDEGLPSDDSDLSTIP